MVANTKIEWADDTFNPWIGCTKVGPGCDFCYAEARDIRFHGGLHWGPGAPRRLTTDAYWRQPLKWNREAANDNRRRLVFCASQADIFDNEVPKEWRDRFWALVRATPNLTWLLVTKRIGNARKMLPDGWGSNGYPNVWLLITVVNQEEADRDIVKLLAVPAVKHGLSVEPMLGSIYIDLKFRRLLGWVICGGESGPKARPLHPDWARWLRDQCDEVGVPFFFKQWGEWGPGAEFAPDASAIAAYRGEIQTLIIPHSREIKLCYPLRDDGRWPALTLERFGKRIAGATLDCIEHKAFPSSQLRSA